MDLEEADIVSILDYFCKISNHREIFYLWRPFLPDPGDDMVLELAVTARCQYIVTFNQRDYKGIEQFNLKAIPPGQFLEKIGALS